jgi:hypothetical protein
MPPVHRVLTLTPCHRQDRRQVFYRILFITQGIKTLVQRW